MVPAPRIESQVAPHVPGCRPLRMARVPDRRRAGWRSRAPVLLLLEGGRCKRGIRDAVLTVQAPLAQDLPHVATLPRTAPATARKLLALDLQVQPPDGPRLVFLRVHVKRRQMFSTAQIQRGCPHQR